MTIEETQKSRHDHTDSLSRCVCGAFLGKKQVGELKTICKNCGRPQLRYIKPE